MCIAPPGTTAADAVSYRLALDHPGRLSKLAVLDIAPTYDYWEKREPAFCTENLSLGVPGAALSAAGDAGGWQRRVFPAAEMASQTKSQTLDEIDPRAGALSRAVPRSRPHSRDVRNYHAGAYADYEIDKADFDAGKKITVPLLALWGDAGVASAATTPLDTWKKWATKVEGASVDFGHFLPEENPDVTARLLREFFLKG